MLSGNQIGSFPGNLPGDYLKFYIDGVAQSGSISGEEDWQKKSFSLSAGSRTLKWAYEKDGGTTQGQDLAWVDGLYVGPSSGDLPLQPPGELAEAVDSSLKFTSSGDSTWYSSSGWPYDYYYDGDSAMSYETLSNNQESCLHTIVESSSSETLKFHWKVSSQQNCDYLEFYIDDVLQSGRISGEVDWTEKSYTLSAGIHSLKWRYVKDSSGSDGDDCGWVDFVQWTEAAPVPDSNDWQQIDYKYDVYGRRSEKKIDGYGTRYLYDGPHVLAEYDGNNNLLRKYVHGPCIDEPICMIEVADSNATYYYHYDALGSVIALSDSSGDTVQTHEYSVFGEPAVEDANHTNPYMFAGRRYDIEIGLYYNRARYYNPYTGRFLQTDPSGYGDGMNMYAYCENNSLNYTDPTGLFALPSIPKECLLPLGGVIGDYDVKGLVASWLKNAGFYETYGNSWDIGEVNVDGDNINIDLIYIGGEGEGAYTEPNFYVDWIVLKHEEGHAKEGEVYGTVPLVVFDGIYLLTQRALDRIIYSAIQEINGWSGGGGPFPAGVMPVRSFWSIYHLLNDWDCEYLKTGPKFRYNHQVFSGSDINFMVGGHAFRHYRWSEAEALGGLALWKANPWYGHSPDDPEMASVYYWFLKGYDEYSSRSGW